MVKTIKLFVEIFPRSSFWFPLISTSSMKTAVSDWAELGGTSTVADALVDLMNLTEILLVIHCIEPTTLSVPFFFARWALLWFYRVSTSFNWLASSCFRWFPDRLPRTRWCKLGLIAENAIFFESVNLLQLTNAKESLDTQIYVEKLG